MSGSSISQVHPDIHCRICPECQLSAEVLCPLESRQNGTHSSLATAFISLSRGNRDQCSHREQCRRTFMAHIRDPSPVRNPSPVHNPSPAHTHSLSGGPIGTSTSVDVNELILDTLAAYFRSAPQVSPGTSTVASSTSNPQFSGLHPIPGPSTENLTFMDQFAFTNQLQLLLNNADSENLTFNESLFGPIP